MPEAAAGIWRSAGSAKGGQLPFLLASQNPDGGWGYHTGADTNIEATAWALLALNSLEASPAIEESFARGLAALRRAQLPDGSWPPFPGLPQGCWTTSLACLALHAAGEAPDPVRHGTSWLAATWPAEHRLIWRLQERFLWRRVARQNPGLAGWNWTPGTASWVEPTAYALILLRSLPAATLPADAGRRIRLAERMLYDRMCPGGGWNTGNPMVYGVGGIPRVGPTVWALLALASHRNRPENLQSLDWLERGYGQIRGRASRALAHLCLRRYGRHVPPLLTALQRFAAQTGNGLGVLGSSFEVIATATVIPAWLAVVMTPSREKP